ncbi:hypothetical protein [Massilia endophytica]|uniref:hypothetical protein n=1 Tax=Massilia endophytica TaxID=2899220 RepID=UPI001E5786E2|nr:hypothetical protein [Massilia endophytica]UGQ47057.1 hypothetical protein LSQ66_00850 [Massilia endophytica]
MRANISLLLECFLLVTSPHVLADNMLTRDQILINGGSRTSTNGRYTLIMQNDGSLVMYRSDGSVRYSMEKYGYYAKMRSDGNFVELNRNNAIIWQTKTNNGLNNFLLVQDDGNLVVYTPGPSSWAVWSIGVDPGPNDPKAIGDIVGRDLAFTGAGYLGHVALWDGGQIAQAVLPSSGNNAIHYTTLTAFKNTPTSTGGIAAYWGTARTPIADGIVQSCYSPTFCDYWWPNATTETTTARVAVAKRARQAYLIGADYTSTAYWISALPRRPTAPAQRGQYRCDTFVVDMLKESRQNASRFPTAEQQLWAQRWSTLTETITPGTTFNKIKAWE